MNKKAKRFAAAAALLAIAALLLYFVISAFLATPDAAGDRFMALLACIIAIPVLAWLLLFCVGRMRGRHTMAELFPEEEEKPGAGAPDSKNTHSS